MSEATNEGVAREVEPPASSAVDFRKGTTRPRTLLIVLAAVAAVVAALAIAGVFSEPKPVEVQGGSGTRAKGEED